MCVSCIDERLVEWTGLTITIQTIAGSASRNENQRLSLDSLEAQTAFATTIFFLWIRLHGDELN